VLKDCFMINAMNPHDIIILSASDSTFPVNKIVPVKNSQQIIA
jgi:hypothetical protein